MGRACLASSSGPAATQAGQGVALAGWRARPGSIPSGSRRARLSDREKGCEGTARVSQSRRFVPYSNRRRGCRGRSPLARRVLLQAV